MAKMTNFIGPIRVIGLMVVISYMIVILCTWIYTNLMGFVYFSAGEPVLVIKYSEWILGFVGLFVSIDYLRRELRKIPDKDVGMLKIMRLKWFCGKILGKELDLKDFDEKITIQKAIYLAQKLGMDFSYSFGWYVRGVYSSSLTVDIYEIHDAELHYFPSKKEINIVNQLLSIKDTLKNTSQTLELVSSILYAKLERNMNEEEIIEFIKSVMPYFSNTDIEKALEVTKQL